MLSNTIIVKHILLPTDFSENSLHAIDYAAGLFQDYDCHFYLLNVQKSSEFITDDIFGASNNQSIYEAIVDDNKKKLNSLLKTYREKHKASEITWHALFDYDVFIDAIRQAIEAKQIDLIIMGSNGATGAKEVLFGSNTLRVIRGVDCPVLMIPEGYQFDSLNEMLFSTVDCKKLNNKTAKIVKDLCQLHHSVLHVLHIQPDLNEPEHGYDFYLRDVLDGIKYKSHSLKGIPISFAIESFEQLFPVTMNVMFVPKESFLDRFLFGSKTSQISYGSDIPLLFLHKSE